jgi:hypothetical protein
VSLSQGDVCLLCPGAVELGILLPHLAYLDQHAGEGHGSFTRLFHETRELGYDGSSPSWQWPANPRIEYMIALYIASGQVDADPRYGDPTTRPANSARKRYGEAAADAVRSGLDWADKTRRRRSRIDAGWRSHRGNAEPTE